MPELPDVEIYRQYASEHVLGQKISKVDYFGDQVLESTRQMISKSLIDSTFTECRREGKYLLMKCGERWLVLHFGMTGDLKHYEKNGDHPEYSQLLIHFQNGHSLAYISKRKLGKIEIVKNIEEFDNDHGIGEDALRMDWETFRNLMNEKKGSIKNALMDQQTISGIGNVYSDEILFQEKIHPKYNIRKLDDDALKSLYKTMRRVLRIAIRHHANPGELPKDYLLANRTEGRDCPVCKGKIEKIEVNGRGTYICPKCQKLY